MSSDGSPRPVTLTLPVSPLSSTARAEATIPTELMLTSAARSPARPRSWDGAGNCAVFFLLRDELLRFVRAVAEEELLHLELEPLAMRGLDRRQPIFVDQHHLVTHPLLPRLLRDVLEDAFAELTRIRRL